MHRRLKMLNSFISRYHIISYELATENDMMTSFHSNFYFDARPPSPATIGFEALHLFSFTVITVFTYAYELICCFQKETHASFLPSVVCSIISFLLEALEVNS